MQRKS